MADNMHIQVDGGTREAETGTLGGGAGASTPQSPHQHEQHEIINSLEVDSNRADNDSSLGSDISSCVMTSRGTAHSANRVLPAAYQLR